MGNSKNKYNRVASDASQLQQFTDEVCEVLSNEDGDIASVKEIVNQGIQDGEIKAIKYGSSATLKKTYHELADFYSLDFDFEPGFCPIQAVFKNSLGEYIIIYFDAGSLNCFNTVDSDGVGAGLYEIHINENQSSFEYELNDGESFDEDSYQPAFIFGCFAEGEYDLVS